MKTDLFAEEKFKVVVLGCHGGPKENNLSCYLLAPIESNEYIALDAGTLLEGIFIATKNKSFDDIKTNPFSTEDREIEIFRSHVSGYFISHAHLDHVSGLIINSTADSKKTIFGIDSTIDFIRDYLFNWKIWPNFASEGTKPYLNHYQYKRLNIGEKISLERPKVNIEPFLLSHPDGYQSTAFLIESSDSYVVYFGDTAPDSLESQKNIEKIWHKIAPLISQNKLRGIFLECSFSSEVGPSHLHGHLNTTYMMEELNKLARLVNPSSPETALKNVKVIVTHIKNTFHNGVSAQQIIQDELKKLNNLNVQLIFPEQGKKIEL